MSVSGEGDAKNRKVARNLSDVLAISTRVSMPSLNLSEVHLSIFQLVQGELPIEVLLDQAI